MSYQLSFATRYEYSQNERGIFLPVTLRCGERAIPCGAKLDSGADHYYFSRELGEALGLDIEQGVRARIEPIMRVSR